MNSLPDLSIDDFNSFFQAVNGYEPFPWQERLARQVEDTGWPALLDLPTGAGKTAALDVAVFALALDAGRPQRRAPLRIVYVVDRRTIVDQAHARAEGALRHALRRASSPVVASVRDRLASFSAAKNPLATVLLRGGIARDDSWARTPDQPLIVVSTVDQVGSRLLFRGYGVADSMRPVHAGLLGHDVLFLLDEVHLSNPFRETLTAIADRYRGWAERSLPVPFRVVEMSATPGSRGIEVFHLAPSDHEHPTLARRLHVSKPAVLVETPRRGFANAVEAQVLPMLAGPGATVAVVVNRVRSARELHARLRGVVAPAVAVHLLTGRMRPIDRDALEASVVPRVKAGRQRRADDTPIVVVATQSIEAGADFDFDGLVTECASIDALKQRFGRLDRLGALAGGARGAIVASPDTFADDPVYGDAIGATWRWLQDAAVTGTVDVGSSALSIPDDAAHLLAPRPSAPILLPSHLDAWVQTSPTPEPDPDVALWLHGPQRGTADVQVVWRSDISEELLRQAIEGGPLRAAAADLAIGMVDALPPVSAEAMSVPFIAARCWLAGEPEADASDVEGGADPDDTSDISAADRAGRPAILWLGESSAVIGADALRPGQTIVVPSSYGGIAHGNWAPDSLLPVSDVAEVAAARQRRRSVVRLHPSVMPPALGRPPEPAPADSTDTDAPSDRELVLGWMSEIPASAECAEWRELLALLEADGRAIRVERMVAGIGEARFEYFIVTGAPRAAGGATDVLPDDDRSSDDEQSSMTGARIGLAAHLDGVAALAASMGQRVGLPADVVSDVQWAAKWHDAGKADPRFQRWLHGGSEFRALVQAEPLAKSPIRLGGRDAIRRARERAGYPAGTRHEFQSLALADAAGAAWAERAVDADLVRHLVASHHGHARPLAPWVPEATPVDVAFSSGDIACAASSAHTLARLDSGIVDRFWILVQRYGWWGLAYLEAILRLADHRQSEREQGHKEARRA
ncbi:MAG: type I-U CRISPR-associated helicase/endonuclease Cas3 [Acidobacteria bacterium]|nr:type I-U CRISPR-associated helicase/endonuclease Cas3 [Acidobacteriota bacterium]